MCTLKVGVALVAFILVNLLANGEEICDMPRDCGPCKALHPKFFFDNVAQACTPFNYGGCAGNDNRFETKEECENHCLLQLEYR